MDKFIFNENLKRIFNCLTNKLVLSQYILKDFISDAKIINEITKKEKSSENNNSQNNKSNKTHNESSQNLVQGNILGNKSSYISLPINQVNTSFLLLNSSFKLLIIEKLEGLIFECKWKKKYILLLKLSKINASGNFYNHIEIECVEMNHYENPFKLELSFYWDSSSLQTILLIKFFSKDKIINEIINREFNTKDRKKIYNNICNWLKDDLTNVENSATILVFASMKEVALYLSDTRIILKYGPRNFNARFEIKTSPLMTTGNNCLVYDKETNTLKEELIFSGYYIDKKGSCEIRWEQKIDGKLFCIFRISIIYLEENMSLVLLKNIYQSYVPAQFLYDINERKKRFFQDTFDYFNKKKRIVDNYCTQKESDMKLKIGIKNNEKRTSQKDLSAFINNDNMINNLDINFEKDQYNSFLDNSNLGNKDGENLFTDTIQNISEISKIQSGFLQGIEEEN